MQIKTRHIIHMRARGGGIHPSSLPFVGLAGTVFFCSISGASFRCVREPREAVSARKRPVFPSALLKILNNRGCNVRFRFLRITEKDQGRLLSFGSVDSHEWIMQSVSKDLSLINPKVF